MLLGFLGHLLCYDDCYKLFFYHAADVVDVGANTTMSYMGLRIRWVCCSKDQGGKLVGCFLACTSSSGRSLTQMLHEFEIVHVWSQVFVLQLDP